jgi:hypothetical protein
VEVTHENPNPNIVVNLGPKAAILSGTVRNALTGRPLSSGFSLHWVNQPTRFFSTSETPSFRLLVPPLQDMTLEVTAPGYQQWTYTAQPVLHLQPGAEVRLGVLLEPSHNIALGHLKYLIPEQYVGWVKVRFDVKGAAPATSENEPTVLRVLENGELETSAPVPKYGAEEEYLFYSPDGSTRPIPNDYWNDHGMVWGEHDVMRAGGRSEINFFVGTEEQFLQRISSWERRFWVIERNVVPAQY